MQILLEIKIRVFESIHSVVFFFPPLTLKLKKKILKCDFTLLFLFL